MKDNINEVFCKYLGNEPNAYIPTFSEDWNLLMEVYNKVLREQVYGNGRDLDILMKIVGDNLLDSDREGFFLSLVEVVKYLNSK
jgi:hypothetical protein